MSNPEQPAAAQNNDTDSNIDRVDLRQRLIESATTAFSATTNNNNNTDRNDHQPQQQQQLITVRDQIFHSLFYRLALFYSKTVPASIRRLIEFLLLLKALLAFFALVYVHSSFAKTSDTCLSSIADSWPRDGILRVEVIGQNGDDKRYDFGKDGIFIIWEGKDDDELTSSKFRKDELSGKNLSTTEDVFTIEKLHYNQSIPTVEKYPLLSTFYKLLVALPYMQIPREERPERRGYLQPIYFSDDKRDTEKDNSDNEEEIIHSYLTKSQYIVEYSMEYGYLRMTSTARRKLKIPVMIVLLDMQNKNCFGDGFSQFILRNILGYDDILMASVKSLVEKQDNRGYLRNVVSGGYYRFIHLWMARITYIPAFFSMILFTGIVSMVLRYAHHQVFVFIVDVLQMLEFNIAITFPTATLLTAVLALIGIEAIMSEFFSDTTIAFYVILMVWLANHYDAICCHMPITKRHWLRFFYLYHFLFYAYHYRFNGQYSSLSLLASWMFIQHSMIYFFHHYELPTIMQQNRLQQLMFVRTTDGTTTHNGPAILGYVGNQIEPRTTNDNQEAESDNSFPTINTQVQYLNQMIQRRRSSIILNLRSVQGRFHNLSHRLLLSTPLLNSPRIRRLLSLLPYQLIRPTAATLPISTAPAIEPTSDSEENQDENRTESHSESFGNVESNSNDNDDFIG